MIRTGWRYTLHRTRCRAEEWIGARLERLTARTGCAILATWILAMIFGLACLSAARSDEVPNYLTPRMLENAGLAPEVPPIEVAIAAQESIPEPIAGEAPDPQLERLGKLLRADGEAAAQLLPKVLERAPDLSDAEVYDAALTAARQRRNIKARILELRPNVPENRAHIIAEEFALVVALQPGHVFARELDLGLRILAAESSFDPNAKNPKSTAKGLGQFLNTTVRLGGYDMAMMRGTTDAHAQYQAWAYLDWAGRGNTHAWVHGQWEACGLVHQGVR